MSLYFGISYFHRVALETIDRLADNLDLTDFASRIIHPLARTLDMTPDLHYTAMDTLCTLVMQLGQKFLIFIPMITKITTKHKIQHQRYNILMCRILKVNSCLLVIVYSFNLQYQLHYIFTDLVFKSVYAKYSK